MNKMKKYTINLKETRTKKVENWFDEDCRQELVK